MKKYILSMLLLAGISAEDLLAQAQVRMLYWTVFYSSAYHIITVTLSSAAMQ